MIRSTLAARVRDALGDLPRAGTAGIDPSWLAAATRLAEASPGDLAWRRLAHDLRDAVGATDGLPPRVAGVRRERLIRWDGWTSTWSGTDTLGRAAMVRVLRPAHRDAWSRRALARDARALEGLVDVRLDDVALVAALPGPPWRVAASRLGRADGLAGFVGRTLVGLDRWSRRGLGLTPLAPEELCDAGDRAVAIRLTPSPAADEGPLLATLAEDFLDWHGDEEDAQGALLAAWCAVPPRTAAEAGEAWTRTLAESLADHRHAVVRRRRSAQAGAHRERLVRLLADLDAATPPPVGRGALGVDLDGRVLVVASDGEEVTAGAEDAPEVVWDPDADLDVPAARRLVRLRAAAPPSARLNAEIGGDPVYVEHLVRWLSARLELRTLRMLLERSGP